MALILSSHQSLDKNLMNHDRLERRYNFKFVTCDSKSLRKNIGGAYNRRKSSYKKSWTNIRALKISRTRALLSRQIRLLIRDLNLLWWIKYQQHRQELQQCVMEEGISTNNSLSAFINDNDIYYDIVGGKNGKENVYGFGGLYITHSTRLRSSLIEMSMVKQLEEMHETIHKLNNELITKKKN
ncbi:hypothetical protein CR513_19552, partial [Mucuna pruriens]